jgi:hypothetical protein
MRVGVICDGDAEVEVLKVILGKLSLAEIELLGAVYADMQPSAPNAQVVFAARSRIEIWRARRVNKIVVVIDREQSSMCPGQRAQELRAAFHGSGFTEVEVVVKDRKLENWLLADAEGVSTLKGFSISDSLARRVRNAGADSIGDAQAELERASSKGYGKRRDAVRIAQVSSIAVIEERSRSFRRFLRHVGHPSYQTQSRHFVSATS